MVGSESPSSLSSDSFRNREQMSLRRSSAGNMTAAQILFRAGGSFKKKLTPTSGPKSKSAAEDSSSSGSGAKGGNKTKSTSNSYSHIRTPSDSHAPVYSQVNSSHRNSGHWRNRSVDLVSNNTATPLSSIGRNSNNQGHNTLSSITTTSDNNKSMSKTPPGTVNGSGQVFSSLQRPRCPPPPLPPHHTNTPVSRTNNDLDHSAARIMFQEVPEKIVDSARIIPVPVPPPRKVSEFHECHTQIN